MDQFKSTYQKDYLWPYVPPKSPLKTKFSQLEEQKCTCYNQDKNVTTMVAGTGEPSWSRSGPMGVLLKPILFPKENVPKEKPQQMRPSEYLKMLKDKYPQIFECLDKPQLASSKKDNDIQSTYVKDFCKKISGEKQVVMQPQKKLKVGFRPQEQLRYTDPENLLSKKTYVYEEDITNFNPFVKCRHKMANHVEKWGQMVYREKC